MSAHSRRVPQPRSTDVLAPCPYLEMDETWSSRLLGRRARTRRVRCDWNCGGAGVVDGACGAVGRVAWVYIGTLSVPMYTPIRCEAGRCAPGPRSGPGEADAEGALDACGAARTTRRHHRTKVSDRITTDPGKTTRQPPDEERTTTKDHRWIRLSGEGDYVGHPTLVTARHH